MGKLIETVKPEKTVNLLPEHKYTIYDAYEEKGFIPDFATPESLAKNLNLFGTTDLAKLELDPRWTSYPKDFREKAYRIASPSTIRAVTPEDIAVWNRNKKLLDYLSDGVINSNEKVDLILSSNASESDKKAMLLSVGLTELSNLYVGRVITGKPSTSKIPSYNTTSNSKIIPKIDNTVNPNKLLPPPSIAIKNGLPKGYEMVGDGVGLKNPNTGEVYTKVAKDYLENGQKVYKAENGKYYTISNDAVKTDVSNTVLNKQASEKVAGVDQSIAFDHFIGADYNTRDVPTGGHSLVNGDVRIKPGTSESSPNAVGVYKIQPQMPDKNNPSVWIDKPLVHHTED